MKIYNTLREMKHVVDSEIYFEQRGLMLISYDEQSDNEESLLDKEFDYELGGKLFIIETEDDLKKVSHMFENTDSNGVTSFATLFDTAAGFDVAGYLPSFNYAFVMNCFNNSGGPGFYIPKHIYMKCPKVHESIVLSMCEDTVISFAKQWSDYVNNA